MFTRHDAAPSFGVLAPPSSFDNTRATTVCFFRISFGICSLALIVFCGVVDVIGVDEGKKVWECWGGNCGVDASCSGIVFPTQTPLTGGMFFAL